MKRAMPNKLTHTTVFIAWRVPSDRNIKIINRWTEHLRARRSQTPML